MPVAAALFGCCKPWCSWFREDEAPVRPDSMADIIVHCVASFALGWFAPEVLENFFKRYKKAAAARHNGDGSRGVNAERRKKRKKKTFEEDDCPICLLPESATSERVRTPCGHVFCRDCIEEALDQFGECPLCRRPCSVLSLRRN